MNVEQVQHKKEVVCTGFRPFSTGVSSSDLGDLVRFLGDRTTVLCFEVSAGGWGTGKLRQARHDRDYMRGATGTRAVYTGLVYTQRSTASYSSMDFFISFNRSGPNVDGQSAEEHNASPLIPKRYELAALLSLDFPRPDGSRPVLTDEQKGLVERIVKLHHATGIPLETFYDAYRSQEFWNTVAPFFPEYTNPESLSQRLADPRNLALELYTALTLATYAPYGAIMVRQPFSFQHPSHGPVESDIDVALVTSADSALKTLSSVKHELGDGMLIRGELKHRVGVGYEQAA